MPAARGGHGLGHRDRPRQEGAAVAHAPAVRRGEHVELPRGRLGPLAIDERDDPIAAGVAVRGDLAEPAAEGGGHERLAASWAAAWISCSERTSSSIPPPEEIARTAAAAPVIVVIEGIPCLTAAVRIS